MYKMVRRSSQVPLKVLEERSKLGSSIHLYVILATLLLVFALSAFMMSPAQHAENQSDKLLGRKSSLLGTTQSAIERTAAHATAARAAAAQAAAAARPAMDVCHTESGAEYHGEDVIEWGTNNLKETAGDCCSACWSAQQRGCNVWVWCGNAAGCGEGKHKECWLKKQHDMQLTHIAGARGTNWTSGALYSDADRQAQPAAQQAHRDALKNNEDLPLVWLDVEIKGQYVGRIHFVLFTKESPRAAENFRQLCTGEHGDVPDGQNNAGEAYHLKGKPFYRIIDGFINQAGANTDSVYGGQFKDDAGGLKLEHDRQGLLSMANTGPDTNDSHFSIMVNKAPHLDGHYTIFGEAVDGFEVIDAVNALARGKVDNTGTADDGAVISDSGQIRKGHHQPNLQLL